MPTEKQRQALLDKVAKADHALRRAQNELDGAVRRARNGQVTWTQLGGVLGTTRQAAQMRFRLVGADTPLTRAFAGIPPLVAPSE